MNLFETERLAVRRLGYDDVDAMVAIYGDREAMRYVGDAEPLPADACRHWVDVTDGNFERRGYGMVAVCDRSSNELIGCVGIVHPGQQPEAEVKYAFRRDQWGKGYATEAVIALVAFGRQNWGVSRLIATLYPANTASQRVLAKAGFHHASDRTNDDGSITQVWESAG